MSENAAVQDLIDYLKEHVRLGEPPQKAPRNQSGAVVQLHATLCAEIIGNPTKDDLRDLVEKIRTTSSSGFTPYDGIPHSHSDIRAWFRDPRAAKRFMILSDYLDLAHISTIDLSLYGTEDGQNKIGCATFLRWLTMTSEAPTPTPPAQRIVDSPSGKRVASHGKASGHQP